MSTLKTYLSLILTLIALNANAQKNLQWGKKIDIKQKCGTYHTLEDLRNDKIDEIGTITNNNSGYQHQQGSSNGEFLIDQKNAQIRGLRNVFHFLANRKIRALSTIPY